MHVHMRVLINTCFGMHSQGIGISVHRYACMHVCRYCFPRRQGTDTHAHKDTETEQRQRQAQRQVSNKDRPAAECR